MKTIDPGNFGWAGLEGERLRFNRKNLVRIVKSKGGSVEDDSAGRWHVLQLIAPPGMLWSEGLKCIKVEWPFGESSEPACRDAASRIATQSFRPMAEEEKALYAEE